ncbi:MAG: SLC13 family permease [Sarcina sp.]
MDSKDLRQNKLKEFLKKEIILIVAGVLAIISSFISTPKLSYINWKDLILLFNLMVVITALKEFKVLDYIGTRLLHRDKSVKRLFTVMILLTFFSSMLITDDVALLTFVPLTMVLSKKARFNPVKLIVFQTIAAITGCALTPMGSSQNLYIFTVFNLTPTEFFAVTIPITIVSFLLLLGFIGFQKNRILDVVISEVHVTHKKLIILYFILFLIVLGSVFHLINYKYVFIIVILVTIVIDRRLFFKVDYSLILTFTAFFIFIGNVSSLQSVKHAISGILTNDIHTYFIGLGISQFISNVPATLLLSPFTHNYRGLILGVNNGGLFSLIGSMASIISYKFAVSSKDTTPLKYITTFALYSIVSLVVLIPASYIILRFL